MYTSLSRRLAAALLLSCAAMPASAQRIDRVVAFGDSYADTGNLREILNAAGLGALYPEAQYPTGRFSGGSNFVDKIAEEYGVTGTNFVNFAIGGAQAGTGNVAGPGLIPGFEQQWIAFTQGGTTYTNVAFREPISVSGVQTAIPAGGLTFNADDLGVFSVGGNDARAYRQTGTFAGADAAAASTAAQAQSGIDALVARGLKRMVFIVGDTGQLPEALGKPSAATGTAFSTGYNGRMATYLGGVARRGVTVSYVDLTAIGNVVRANPARFGFRDVTSACPEACIGNTALQDQYFFYVDGVHLTSAAFDLVGLYAVNQLAAPYTFRANGDLPAHAADEFGRALGARLDLARARPQADGFSTWGSFVAAHDHRDADEGGNATRTDDRGGILGAEYGSGRATLGAAISWSRGRARDDGARARADDYLIGGYAGTHFGNLYAQAYGGYGWANLHIHRDGVADPLTASTDSESWLAGGRGGYLLPAGALRVGPTVAVDYARTHVDGYTEVGDAAAALGVGGQTVRQLVGSAGLEGRFEITPAIAPWARVEAEKRLLGDGRTVDYEPQVATVIVNSFAIPSASRHVYGAVTGGISAQLARAVSLEVQARATFERREGNSEAGQAGLRLSF
jgi:phospholipase/lecithinase/hemolysin/uncharacterized protein YhjY with autotransporter beta-barrel domain